MMPSPLNILVAEDEPLSAMAIQAQLEAVGHTVVGPAHDGRQAVELARTNPLDVALLDVRMPRLSGIEAAAEIFRIQPVPVILLSGYSAPELLEQAARLPIFHHLVKPVSMEELEPAISLARRRFREWQEADALLRRQA